MTKKIYKDVPPSYPVCLHESCQRAERCLHRTVYDVLAEGDEMLRVISPSRCRPDGACPYFRDATPVRFARGFTKMQQRMHPGQYAQFMSLLVGRFGRNPYFERRRGDTPMPPAEQKMVKDALKRAGVSEDLAFDAYEDNVNWYD